MTLDEAGNVTLSVDELNAHLQVRGEAARDVGVAGAAALVLVGNALGWGWVPWVLLLIAGSRLAYGWRTSR